MARWIKAACGLAFALGAVPAYAQAPAQPATLLHLSATRSVSIDPDELVAGLTAQNTSPSPAAAQRQVNGMVASAMKLAAAVPGVAAKAVDYSVDRADEKRGTWIAQQTVDLRGTDGPALLDLVGKLQANGLVVSTLDWQISAEKQLRAHDAAMDLALKALQERAATAAAALGMQVDHVQDVRLDDADPNPPRPMTAAKMAFSVPAPQATAARADVRASVSADIVLRR
jgi:predicted secreted protein